MTPKEKAINLYKYMFQITESQYESKQCALIAVDEMINYLELNGFSTQIEYWQEVKQEINNL